MTELLRHAPDQFEHLLQLESLLDLLDHLPRRRNRIESAVIEVSAVDVGLDELWIERKLNTNYDKVDGLDYVELVRFLMVQRELNVLELVVLDPLDEQLRVGRWSPSKQKLKFLSK